MSRGYTKTSTGFRAWVRVSDKKDAFDELRTKRFGRSATVTEIQAWRKKTRGELETLRDVHRQRHIERVGVPGTFRHDAIDRYLPAVQAMPTYAQRVKDIQVWVDSFGDRARSSIQPHEIRALRDQWLTVGPKWVWRTVNGRGQYIAVAQPLSASRVNQRLRALQNLWTVLDGRRAPNPVREVAEADQPQSVPRSLDYTVIRQILDAMPDRGPGLRGKPRVSYSLAKVRARVLAWTGITPKELATLEPHDIHFDDAFLVVPARRKGRGAPGRMIPLGEDALAALREFHRVNAYGRFNQRNVLRAWHTASKAVLGRTTRVYDLRHSFITAIVRATHDTRIAGRLAGHRDARTTDHYAASAMLASNRSGITAAFPDKEKPQ